MSAHTLDLEYAQSHFCLLSRKGKAAQQMKLGRQFFCGQLARV